MTARPPAAIVDKIAKLLNLSRGKGTTAHEAAAAAAKAQALMERHRIDQAAVDKLRSQDDLSALVSDEPLDRLGRPVPWKLTLGANLAGLNCCRLVALPSRHRAGAAELIVIGVGEDVSVVRHFYGYLSREIDRLARGALAAERRARFRWSRPEAQRWGVSFRIGAVNEVILRLRRAKQAERQAAAASGHSRALVLLDDHEKRVLAFVNRFVGGGSYGEPGSGFRQDLEAHVAGRRAGRAIALNHPLAAGSSAPQLGQEPGARPKS